MREWAKQKWKDALEIKLQIAIFLFSSVNVFTIAWQTSVANIELSNLNKWQWINLWIGIIGLWTNNIISLLTKTGSRISEGKAPFNEGDTQIIKRDITKESV